jgi:2-phosphosulfolactate phosphatase
LVIPDVYVHLLPRLFEPEQLRGGVAVVIDVLRASTTIIHALAAGADQVIPCGEVDVARALAQKYAAGTVLLGGERHGERIPSFDLDNSPLKYTEDVLAGKTLVFTTTNGTRALESCHCAARVLIGAFVNQRAVIKAVCDDGRPVHLVCAGTDGLVTSEDVLFAGSIAHYVMEHRGIGQLPDDETQLALALWRSAMDEPAPIRQILRDSRGGLNLLELGFDADIDRAAMCDLFDIVPEFDLASRQIR